jgi:hypothetical protein
VGIGGYFFDLTQNGEKPGMEKALSVARDAATKQKEIE